VTIVGDSLTYAQYRPGIKAKIKQYVRRWIHIVPKEKLNAIMPVPVEKESQFSRPGPFTRPDFLSLGSIASAVLISDGGYSELF
jgi:hypothetical protein